MEHRTARPLAACAIPMLLVALLAAACGSETAIVERFAPQSAPPPHVKAHVDLATEPPPPPSASSLTLAGDFTVEDHDPDVVVEPLAAAAGREPRLRLEIRHRTGGSSQPDALVVFLNVPAEPGTYRLHGPEDPLLPSRVYAFVTTRGDALGSMKDFKTAVAGTLTLRREVAGLAGTFQVAAQEPPPPPPPKLLPGEAPRPLVGTIPPAPPGRVEASGTLLAVLRADSAGAPDAAVQASDESDDSRGDSRRGGSARSARDSGRTGRRIAAIPPGALGDRTGG